MTVHQLKPQEIGPDKPGLSEMCDVLMKHWRALDDMDKDFVIQITRIELQGNKAKIETIEEGRAIAWSILNRHGLADLG